VGDEAVAERIGAKEDGVARALVVEREALAAVPDGDEAAVEPHPVVRDACHRREPPSGLVHRLQRIARQHVLDVGEHQLLVLLLVLQTEFDQRIDLGVVRRVQQGRHTVVHGTPIRHHLGQRRTRHQPALRTRMLGTDLLVVAVVEHTKLRIVRPEVRLMALEHHRLEEPGHVREVPLGGAGVGHRLHLAVGLRQRCGQGPAARTHAGIPLGERVRRRSRHRQWIHVDSSRVLPWAM
jgi:hypothetical protein